MTYIFLNIARGRVPAAMLILTVFFISSCALNPTTRMGMVKDEKTGLLYGSEIEAVMITEPSFYTNPKIKVRVRNTSGDTAFNLKGLQGDIEAAYADIGYKPTQEDDFGLLLNVNVRYSGHIQKNLAGAYSFLGTSFGAASGFGVDGTRRTATIGALAGSTIGTVIGAFTTEDTYIIVSDISFGVVKKAKLSGKRITFSRSAKLKNIDDPNEDDKTIARGFKRIHHTGLAVYAGGINVKQQEITDEVRARMIRIVGEFL